MQGDRQRSRSPSSRGENLYNTGNMPHETSSFTPESMAPGNGSHAITLTHVAFSADGQPIGHNSTVFCSHIGNVTRTNVPPNYTSWKKVPDAFKDQVWDAVCFSYEVPVCHKRWVLKKANDSWRDWKSLLRRTVYDKYDTNAERKAHVPSHVRQEDWESFVDINSTELVQASREKGRIARSKMICPHTSGRKGQARVAEDMRQENPGVEITRTDLFLRTHTKKDGSVTCPKVDAVRSLHEANRSLAQQDLNNDPVAKLIGRDSRGRVRGLGMGVSKTSISYGAPYMKALADEKSSHEKIENKLVQLMEETAGGFRKEIDELKQSLSQGGTLMPLMRSSTHHLHYSQARNDSPHQETRTNRASEQTGMTIRRLMHLVQKDVCIAYGTVIGSSLEYPGCYRIVMEEILDYSAQLVNRDKTFGNLTLGDMIDWPMYKTLY